MSRETIKAELDYLNKDNDPMQNMVTDNVLEVYDVLSKQGHSGFSFSYVTSLIKKLVFEDGLIKPIQAYEDEPDDWITHDPNGSSWQNKRRSSVFYDKDTGIYSDVDKCLMTDNDGESWWHTGGWFRTFCQIKVPYKPDGKKWYVYIEPAIELVPGYGADDGEYIIKEIEYR